jgi:hypothetical protein
MKSRLHIYPHDGPQGTVYIAGEPAALQGLAKTLMSAARSHVGFENIKLYSSDGHEYTVTVIATNSEEEWQASAPPYVKIAPPRFKIINDYESLKAELTDRNRQ